MFTKSDAIKYVDEKHLQFEDISHKIWEYAELSLKEHKSAALYVEALKKEGFEVETNLSNIETAFLGKAGSGRPYIGILGEFDALSGLSQKGCVPYKEPLVKGASGHGCGHNMLGAASFGAAVAVKKYLEETGKPGTVIFYGCPGEEGGAAKAFFARDHVFDGVDAALTWHPGTANEVTSGTCNSCIQTEYRFKGIASHAAGAPEHGRSALDAVQLMNMGTEFIREHMPDGARIHYAITDTGGPSPNVVQPHARVLYMVRSRLVKDALKLQERVDRCAQGASLMTDTTLEKVFIDGCSNTVTNKVLEELLYETFKAADLPAYTPEEYAYARALMDSVEYKSEALPAPYLTDPEHIAYVAKMSENGTVSINDFLVPYEHRESWVLPMSAMFPGISPLPRSALPASVPAIPVTPGRTYLSARLPSVIRV